MIVKLFKHSKTNNILDLIQRISINTDALATTSYKYNLAHTKDSISESPVTLSTNNICCQNKLIFNDKCNI